MKECRKCGEHKSLTEYYSHPMMADGHLNICKGCVKERVSHYRKTVAGKLAEKRRQKSKRRKEWNRKYQKIRRKRDKEKYIARSWVSNAVRDGRIEKKPCEVCGSVKVEAHHPDYAKPKEVRWLCMNHHQEIHPHFKRKYQRSKH